MLKRDPFNIERQRTKLASKDKYLELKKTYSSEYPEIKNANTSNLWNDLNKREDLLENSNPMESDKLKWVSNEIKSKFGHSNKLHVLNIGFGSGNLEERTLKGNESNFDWQGIDISEESVKTMSRKYKKSSFVVGDILKLPYKNESYDYVVALEVLEHISPKNTFKALNQIISKLKSGGRFILSVPLNEGLEEMVKRGENPNAHVRVYTPELIQAELEIAGFHVLETKTIYAFKSFYHLKTFLVKYLFKNMRQPNGIIVVAQKP